MYIFRLVQLIFPVITLGLTSCVSTPDNPPPLPQFQSITIITAGETKEDLQADSTTFLVNTRVGGGAAAGAAAGAAIGLTCGPGAFFCVPITALIGAISGAWAGVGLTPERGLRKEHNRQVNEVLENLRTDLKLNEMLRQSLSGTLPDFVDTLQSDAKALVQVRVKLLELRQNEKERVSLNIAAEMKTSWAFGGKKNTVQTNQYQCKTIIRAVKNLLVDPGKKFNHDIRQCVDHIAGLMARDLGYPVESPSD
jgi:hypothetical protein